MNLKIKLIDKTLPMPRYETSKSAAFDLYSRIDITVKPFEVTIIPLNVVIKFEPGYFLMLAARSSLPIKKKLMVANSIGVIDEDYCGDDDEIGLEVLNFSKEDVVINKGDKIAQSLLVKIARAENFNEVDTMDDKSRGGFGSTG